MEHSAVICPFGARAARCLVRLMPIAAIFAAVILATPASAQSFENNQLLNGLDRPFAMRGGDRRFETGIPKVLPEYPNGNRVFRYDGRRVYEDLGFTSTVGSKIGYRYDEYYVVDETGTVVNVSGNTLNVNTNGNFNTVIVYSQQVNTGDQSADVTNDDQAIEIR